MYGHYFKIMFYNFLEKEKSYIEETEPDTPMPRPKYENQLLRA